MRRQAVIPLSRCIYTLRRTFSIAGIIEAAKILRSPPFSTGRVAAGRRGFVTINSGAIFIFVGGCRCVPAVGKPADVERSSARRTGVRCGPGHHQTGAGSAAASLEQPRRNDRYNQPVLLVSA
ncbi:hypothetical protein KCP78_20520 [Salmonella enterica subsp. enterica]|nr:hypothetical protein KCP78_20520 [Salmonella enterica subsp. enterica]